MEEKNLRKLVKMGIASRSDPEEKVRECYGRFRAMLKENNSPEGNPTCHRFDKAL